MRRALYEEDFRDPASKEEFADSLVQADDVFELPLRGSIEAVKGNVGDARARQYEQVGIFIGRHSQILIALWDGTFTNLTGGTSEIVRFHIEGLPRALAPPGATNPLDTVESGRVYHVVTPRDGQVVPEASLTRRVYYPELGMDHPVAWSNVTGAPIGKGSMENESLRLAQERYATVYRNLEGFNADAVRQAQALESKQEASKQSLFPNRDQCQLSARVNQILDNYALADSLAISFRTGTDAVLRLLFVCAFLAVLGLQLYDYGPRWFGRQWVLLTYPAFLITAFGLWRFFVKLPDVQNKYQDYRALAEGLRVQLFWRLAGLHDSASDHYLRRQAGELAWIRSSMRALDIPPNERDLDAHDAPLDKSRYTLVLNLCG